MAIKQHTSKENNQVTIKIDDHFDYSLHQNFRNSYINEKISNCTFIIDLTNATYMDSSALGMILLLKDHADSLGGKVIIAKPNEGVNKVLEIAQFNKLITIEH